jgi:hypothetical protein
MIAHRREIARFQSDLYRDRYYKMLRSLIILAGTMFVLIAAIIYVLFTTMVPPFYGSTTEGRIIPMMPISAIKGTS